MEECGLIMTYSDVATEPCPPSLYLVDTAPCLDHSHSVLLGVVHIDASYLDM